MYKIAHLNNEEMVGIFHEMKIEKVTKQKVIYCVLSAKRSLYKTIFSAGPEIYIRSKVTVELVLPNYARKSNVQKATVLMHYGMLRSQLVSLISNVDKLDINELKTVPPDLCKPSNAVNDDVVRKTVYDKQLTSINDLYTGELVSETHNLKNNIEGLDN